MEQLLKKYGFLILSFSIIISFNNSVAQNANDALRLATPGLGSNARALGMGDAYIGLSDDASAAFFNPAGFGLLKKMEISGNLSYLSYKNNTTFFNNETNASNSNTKLNRISFAFPVPTIQGSLVFGLSYHTEKNYTARMKFDGFNNTNMSYINYLLLPPNPSGIPYDLGLASSNDITTIHGSLNQSGDILSSGSLNYWTFSGAIEISKNVFIGANINIATGKYTNNNDYYEDDTHNLYQGLTDPTDSTTTDFQTFYLNRVLNWDISGWNAKLGIIYQLNDNARFGVTVQFPKNFTIKEDFSVNGYGQFGSGYTYQDNNIYSDNVQYDITTPYELAGGFSWNYKGLILSGQATLIDYSQTQFSNGDGLDASQIADINKNIKDQLTSVFNYNLGVEYTVPETGLRLRGGFFVQPSAYSGDPSKYDKKYVTVGFGFLTDQSVGFDFAYAHGWWQNFGDNYGSNLSRTYQDITDNQFFFTAIYRF